MADDDDGVVLVVQDVRILRHGADDLLLVHLVQLEETRVNVHFSREPARVLLFAEMIVGVLADSGGLHVEEVQVGLPRRRGLEQGTAEGEHERAVWIGVRLDRRRVEQAIRLVDRRHGDVLGLGMRLLARLAGPRGDGVDWSVRRGCHRGHGFGVRGLELERPCVRTRGRDEEREAEVHDDERDDRARDPRAHDAERVGDGVEAATARAERVAAADGAARVPGFLGHAALGLEQRGGFVPGCLHRRGRARYGIDRGVGGLGVHGQEPLDLSLEVLLLLAHRGNRARFERMSLRCAGRVWRGPDGFRQFREARPEKRLFSLFNTPDRPRLWVFVFRYGCRAKVYG